jgi:hypothetical protein
LLVVGAHALAHEERDCKHHKELEQQRNAEAEHIERELHNRLARQRE